MIVYGDPHFPATAGALLEALRRRLRRCSHHNACDIDGLDELRTLLILAGQLEQALVDANPAIDGCSTERLTDRAAAAFHRCWRTVSGVPLPDCPDYSLAGELRDVAAALEQVQLPPDLRLTVKVPEGYAFYTLYPEQYAVAADRWLAERPADEPVLVVGIRTIGTSLSAVVAQALAASGRPVRRITVRPSGHPYERHVEIPPGVLGQAAHAVVVDEGPGLSGSSMAAVAEALSRAGLPPGRISFFPGHAGEPGHAASDAVRYWWRSVPRYLVPLSQLRWSGRALPEVLASRTNGDREPDSVQVEDLGGGGWRRAAYADEEHWPAVCPGFEQAKYRCTSAGGYARLWKFTGLAPVDEHGSTPADAALERPGPPERVADASHFHGTTLGFTSMPWIDGERLTGRERDPELLSALGRHAAAVAGAELSSEECSAAMDRLREMTYWNVWEALGEAMAERTRPMAERAERLLRGAPQPCYGDGRMGPWEWVRRPDGGLVKTDCGGHHLDHTVVGRQPAIWDLAGAMVEWDLDTESGGPLLSGWHGGTGMPVDPAALDWYRLAYAACRLGQVWISSPADAREAERAGERRQALLRHLSSLLQHRA